MSNVISIAGSRTRQKQPSKWRKTVFTAMMALVLTACADDSEVASNKNVDDATEVDVFVVTPQEVGRRITANGSIMANEEVELRAEISGRILGLQLNEGKSVRKGDLLVQIDDTEFRAQKRKLESQLSLAEKDAQRKAELLEINGISKEVYDNVANLIEELNADIDLVNSQIRSCQIIAPFSGKIGLRYISPGAFLTSGDRIALLVQDDPVKIEFPVPQRYASMIHAGKDIQFSLEGASDSLQAEIYATEPRVDLATRTLKVRARCPNPDGKLIPGSFVEVDVLLETLPEAMMIPTEVIVPQLKGEKVLVIKDGKVSSSEVTTGLRTDRRVQLTSGVEVGDTLIATALLALKDGMPVKVRSIQNAEEN